MRVLNGLTKFGHNPMRVVFRVDASFTSGLGHLTRCLTLARELASQGATILFISREHQKGLCNVIESRGFELYCLPGPQANLVFEDSPAHSAWLGASWQDDARQTSAVLADLQEKPDWLVVDHYAIDERWEIALAPLVKRVMVIDDLADRRHFCDVLLDQNLVAEFDTRYFGKVPDSCQLLLGPKYALLQPQYSERPDKSTSKSTIHRILVFFGGADQRNLTGLSIAAFIALDRTDIDLDVVIGNAFTHADSVLQQIRDRQNIRLYRDLPSLAPLMKQADLAIGAGGTTSWERLCLGLPALVVTLAENQRPIAAELHRRRLIRWLGDQDQVNEIDFTRALQDLLVEGALQSEFLNGADVVDGKGAGRVREAMTVFLIMPMRIRNASHGDEAILLKWANDPVTRKNAFSVGEITPQAHCRWFHDHLMSLDSVRLYIVETVEGEALGQVRFELEKGAWVVDYSLSPVFRGLGLGSRLLQVAISELRREQVGATIFGEVKINNRASRRVFESLGFTTFVEDSTVKYISRIPNA